MKVTVKLFALLGRYLPAGAAGNQAEIDVKAGATPADVMAGLGLPAEAVHLVLVNGRYVAPPDHAAFELREGDAVAMWPPVAGG